MGWHRGGEFSWADHDNDQWTYAVKLSNWMRDYLISAQTPWLHIGADPERPDPIAQLLGERFGCRVDSTSDWKASQEAQNGLYGVSMCCRTLDHLLDIRGALRAVQGFLRPGGLFYGDILDTEFGPQEFKIDHPYQLTVKTMKLYLRNEGFELLDSSRQIDEGHWSFLCRVP